MKSIDIATAYKALEFSAIFLIVFSIDSEAATATAHSTSCPQFVTDIEVSLVSKTGPTTGRVRVTGVLKNLSHTAWTAPSPKQRLQMVLARKNSEQQSNGDAVQPAIGITQLAPGQQYRIDHQMAWDVNASNPKFIVRVSNIGCRVDGSHKEISAAEINKLFVASSSPSATQPLKVQSYRLLGGVGINTVEATLVYRKASSAAGKLTASVAAPYSGISDEIPIAGNHGAVKIHINIPCDFKITSKLTPPPITITYRLWGSLSLSGSSSWVAGFSTQQVISYNELCVAAAMPNIAKPL